MGARIAFIKKQSDAYAKDFAFIGAIGVTIAAAVTGLLIPAVAFLPLFLVDTIASLRKFRAAKKNKSSFEPLNFFAFNAVLSAVAFLLVTAAAAIIIAALITGMGILITVAPILMMTGLFAKISQHVMNAFSLHQELKINRGAIVQNQISRLQSRRNLEIAKAVGYSAVLLGFGLLKFFAAPVAYAIAIGALAVASAAVLAVVVKKVAEYNSATKTDEVGNDRPAPAPAPALINNNTSSLLRQFLAAGDTLRSCFSFSTEANTPPPPLSSSTSRIYSPLPDSTSSIEEGVLPPVPSLP